MNIGYVQQKEYKKGEDRIKWFEMSIRVPFGSCTLTMAKRTPKEGDAENAPDFDLWFSPNRRGESFDRMKAGSLWMKTSEKGNTYLSGYLESPLIASGKMYISVVKYVHQEGMKFQPILYNVLWSPPRENNESSEQNGGNYGGYSNPQTTYPTDQNNQTNGQYASIPEVDIDEDEIPFN